jgi:dephospho-CoA kinase
MIIGLTGGIGSGKSTVSRLFSILGCAVFNSDKAGRDAYLRADVKEKVIRLLGESVFLSDGSVDRTAVSERVFNDPELLRALNHIIHPAVLEATAAFAASHPNELIVKESALLFEAGIADQCDAVVVVTAPERVRIDRVTRRDKADEKAVRNRIRHQMPEEKKTEAADFVIVNDGEVPLIPQVMEVWRRLKDMAA